MNKIDNFKDLCKVMQQRKYNKPNTYKKEGDDHINISLQSNLPIGQFLDPSYVYNFDTGIGGEFKSVLNLIFWLRSDPLDDGIRVMKRSQLMMLARSRRLKPIKNHLLILLYYTYQKVLSNEVQVANLKKLKDGVEVLSYKTDKKSNLRITNGNASIVCPVMTEVIAAIKEDREPNYSRFIDNPSKRGKTIYLPPPIKAILDNYK